MMKKNKLHITVLLVIAIIIVVNMLADQFYFRLDFTEDRQYTLSKATKDILKDLQEPVTVKAFFSKDLRRMKGACRSIRFSIDKHLSMKLSTLSSPYRSM